MLIYLLPIFASASRLLRESVSQRTLLNDNSDLALSTAVDACLRSSVACDAYVNALNDSALTLQTKHPNAVWLFSYGSNMHHSKREKWDVHPFASFPAYVEGRAVRFDTVFKAPDEPSFANLVECPRETEDGVPINSCAHGTVSLVLEDDVNRMSQSEVFYSLRPIEVTTYGGSKLNALTYISPREMDEPTPSNRYAHLVYCGAVESNLHPAYIKMLRDFLFGEENVSCKQPSLPLEISFIEGVKKGQGTS